MVSINDITVKRELLYSLTPFSEGVKALKRRADLVDFAFSNLRLNGSRLTREGVQNILSGNTISGVPVFDHLLCEAHRKLLARFDDKIHMMLDMDTILLNEFCTVLSGMAERRPMDEALPPYREGTDVLYHLDFVPGDENRITSDLSRFFSSVKRRENEGIFESDEGGGGGDFCLKAAAIHMGVVKVYPYAEGFSEMAARAAMQYELIKAGYFTVDIGLSEQEYNRMVSEAVKTEDASEFASCLRVAVIRKLNFLIDAVERGV